MRRSLPVVLAFAITPVAVGVALAEYGDPPTKREISRAKGPISSITEINRNADSGIRGLVYASEKPRELFMHVNIGGLPGAGELRTEYTTGRCGHPAGRSFQAWHTMVDAVWTRFRGVVKTPVTKLSRSITLRTRALRVYLDDELVGCGPVVVLRLTNEDPNP